MNRCSPAWLMAVLLVAGGCNVAPPDKKVEASYDKNTGKLSQLTVDAAKDGKPNIYSYMDGGRFVRIEIDDNEDGKIDRWEYYGPDQKIEKIGSSRLNDGKPDLWAYQGPDGTVAKLELSSKHDGRIDRVEFYEKGMLVRAEQDSDGDGRPDKWETYADGALTTVGLDTKHTGRPNQVIDYRKERPTPSK